MFAIEKHLSSEELKRIRKKLNCTQQVFADFLGVSKKTVEHWEQGNTTVTGPAVTLIRILKEQPEWFEYYKVPPKEYPIRLWYMFRNEVCTLIDVNEAEQRVRIRNYTDRLQFRAFGRTERPSFSQYEDFLESRCFPRGRDMMKVELKKLDIPFYDPFLIIEKTEGRMEEDEFWIRVEK